MSSNDHSASRRVDVLAEEAPHLVAPPRRSIRLLCRACDGTGQSRYRERDCCDVCNGHGTVLSYVELSA